jgi:hypothetical protein
VKNGWSGRFAGIQVSLPVWSVEMAGWVLDVSFWMPDVGAVEGVSLSVFLLRGRY